MLFGDDLVSVVSSTAAEDEAQGNEDHELKYDPDAVKTELVEFDDDENQIDDAFLRRMNCEDDDRGQENAERTNTISEESPTSRRPRRSRTSKRIFDPSIVEAFDDADDEDWNERSPSKKRKKSTKTESPRSRKVRKTQRNVGSSNNMQPQKKSKRKGPSKKKGAKLSEWRKVSEVDSDEVEAFREQRRNNKASRKGAKSDKGNTKGRRKKVSEMTEAEREVMKAKWREEARLKRERQRQRMTPEEREEYLRRHREQRRMQRAMQKITMTEEEREEYNRKARERKREKRSQLTQEEKRERAQRVTLRRIERLAQMNEDEKSQYRMNNYMSYMARLSRMTPEEIEERKQKRREYAKKRLEKLTEEDRAKRRLKIRQYRWNMDPDRKERFLKQLREGYRRRVERLKSEGKWDEVKEKWRRENKEKKHNPSDPSVVKNKGPRRTKLTKSTKETAEERRERLREQRRRNQQKAKIKKKLAIQQLLEQGMSLEEINRQMETPEQRERRLMKCRINKAKLDLRKRLISSGAPPDEIQSRLEELAETYQPSRNFRPYKPRPETWKPIEPDVLKGLTGDDTSKAKPVVKTISVGGATLVTAPVPANNPSNLEVISIPEQEVKIQIEFQPETPQYFNAIYAPSPAAASSCSYISTAVTPEPVVPILQQQYASQQQSTQYETACLYPDQQPTQHYATFNLPTSSPPQAITLHHIIDTMGYSEVATSSSAPTTATVVFHTVSKDYASSFDPSSPPPVSPSQQLQFELSTANSTCSNDFSQDDKKLASSVTPSSSAEPTTSDGVKRKRGRPRKGDPPVVKPPKKGGRRMIGQPIGALHKDVNRDAICDECGNAYNSVYLQEHKRNFHNPHYKNGECTLCGEKFKQSRNFYKHFKEAHNEKQVPLPSGEKKHMCEGCGRAFHQEGNMRKHWYYMHGPGRLSENFHKCHLCPGEKFFKQKLTLLHHFKRCHPGYNPGVYKCSRCTDAFPNELQLNEHVQEKHPEAYWPCKYCKSVKYSELGLKFHYSNGCLKVPKEEWVKLRKEIGDNSIERLQVKCEFCDRVVGLMNLKRHYWELHNVEEETFPCIKCDKKFKRREYLGAHIVDYHNMQPEQWLDAVRMLNVKDRSKIDVKNLEGKQGGAPFNPLRKPEVDERIKANGGKVFRKGKSKKMKQTFISGESSEESDEVTEKVEVKKQSGRRRGRPRKENKGQRESKKSVEHNLNSSDEGESDSGQTDPAPLTKVKRSRGRQRQRKIVTNHDIDTDDEYVPPGRRKSSKSLSSAQDTSEKANDEDAGESLPDNVNLGESSDTPNVLSTGSNVIEEGSCRIPSINPVVSLTSDELENVVKTEVLSDAEDVQIAWIFKD